MIIESAARNRVEDIISDELLCQYWGTAGTGETEAQYITRQIMPVIAEAWAEGVRATTTDAFEVAWAERCVIPRNPYREGQ